MNAIFTPTQEALGRAARKFLQKDCPAAFIRQLYTGDRSQVRPLWQEAAKRGFAAALVPKEFRGAGLKILDVVPILQEVGRALTPGPFVETLGLAIPLVDRLGTPDQKQQWLPEIAAGNIAVTMGLADPNCAGPSASVTAERVQGKEGFVLTGTLDSVMDADFADLILLAADSQHLGGLTLFMIPANTPGMTVEAFPGLDRTRHHSNVRLENVEVGLNAVLGPLGGGCAPLDDALNMATVAMCGSMVGGAERVVEMAAEYARTRQQYGQIIGKFQGIKHKCSDMLVALENSKSATYYAAWAVSSGEANAAEAVSVAKNFVCQAFSHVSSENIQIHGGIGFTWEHEAHWYLKRAKASEVLLGSPRTHRERLAAILDW